MNPLDFAIGVFAAVAAVLVWRQQRAAAPPPPFPLEWRVLLEQRLPLLRKLTPELRRRHERRVQEFLGEIRFVGCNGLVVTDEMRVLIAGLACLLVLRPDASVFRGLHAVLLYPTAFWVPHQEPDELGLVSNDPQLQIGESWHGDRVVLSWEDVEAALAGDPVNVVAHEFAHQLNDESPDTPGAPLLPDYTRWSRVMQAEYARLHEDPAPLIDPYGLEGPAEFFSVVTEAYFQSGPRLKRRHPELYALLCDYYLVDTA